MGKKDFFFDVSYSIKTYGRNSYRQYIVMYFLVFDIRDSIGLWSTSLLSPAGVQCIPEKKETHKSS